MDRQVDFLAEKIYSNMSQCHLKKGNWKRAVETADQVSHNHIASGCCFIC